jgi:hypothetical protein
LYNPIEYGNIRTIENLFSAQEFVSRFFSFCDGAMLTTSCLFFLPKLTKPIKHKNGIVQ